MGGKAGWGGRQCGWKAMDLQSSSEHRKVGLSKEIRTVTLDILLYIIFNIYIQF